MHASCMVRAMDGLDSEHRLQTICRYPAHLPQVEATKFTEVGYHGRDVDTIIRDLLENAIGLVRQRLRRQHEAALRAVSGGRGNGQRQYQREGEERCPWRGMQGSSGEGGRATGAGRGSVRGRDSCGRRQMGRGTL